MTSPNPNQSDIDALNGLVQAVIDSADGYRDAAAEAEHPGHAELFQRRELERRQLADDLSSTVRALGGEPATEGSILAKARRAFADAKHALLRDEVSVIGALEAVEDALDGRFDKAETDTRLSATTRDTVRRAHDRVRAGHDEMAALKHSLEGQRDASNPLFPK